MKTEFLLTDKPELSRLRQAIAQQDTLGASLVVASRFRQDTSEQDYFERVEDLVSTVKARLAGVALDEKAFRHFVQLFYTELAFSGNDKDHFASRYSLVSEVIDYRTGIPVTLSILFCHIAQRVGFDVSGVNFPGHFLLRYQGTPERACFIDPLNGQFLSWRDLEELYFSVLDDLDEDEMPEDALDAANTEEIVVRLLNNLKAAFIKEEQYPHALICVELLVELCPDDPYERRDRGMLVHQLECAENAMEDYRFFIERCPQDPAAQLLKLQLRKYTNSAHRNLH